MEIKILCRQGHSIRAIVHHLGISCNTVREYLHTDKPPVHKERPDRQPILDPYKPCVQERVVAARPEWIRATVLLWEIENQGYEGGIRLLRYYLDVIWQ